MARDSGIFIELFPPISWDEEGIRAALEIQEAADKDAGECLELSPDEIAFLARAIAYYMSLDPSEWQGCFNINTDIHREDPNENGRFVINMSYPEHLEAPTSLR